VLHGEFEVDGLSPNGRKVYLVHWRRNGYDLQHLDLATHRLAATRLDEPDEKMSGTAVNAVATRDGRRLFTLYSKPNGHSFVHALDLGTSLAHCIDLALKGDFFVLGATVLSLSPDEATLYLTNPYLGQVTSVDLETLEVTRVVRFRGLSPHNLNMIVGPSAASTPNGRMLAFTGQKSVWLYDTAFGVVRRAASFRSSVTGVGFQPDGRRLLVLQRNGLPAFLDAATGKRV
jgi:WD40 repeat protein